MDREGKLYRETEKDYPLNEKPVAVGRNRNVPDGITLDYDLISRQHGLFGLKGDEEKTKVFYRDRKSTNGSPLFGVDGKLKKELRDEETTLELGESLILRGKTTSRKDVYCRLQILEDEGTAILEGHIVGEEGSVDDEISGIAEDMPLSDSGSGSGLPGFSDDEPIEIPDDAPEDKDSEPGDYSNKPNEKKKG